MRRIALLALSILVGGSCSKTSIGGGGSTTFDATRYVGTWAGTWNNTTFNSTGAVQMVVAQNGATYNVSIDLGGNVFGGGDPAPESLVVNINSTNATLSGQTSATYGELTATLNADGTLSVNGTNISVGSVTSFALTGNWTTTQVTVNVTINFSSGSPAAATATLTKQ